MPDLEKLPVFDDSGDLNVIIETPQGSRNKFKFAGKLGTFKLARVLPAGAVFPFDFGFVPSTRAQDGDPIDLLLLMDEPVAMGCLVASRLIGVIEAEQSEDGKTERNDRLIGVASLSRNQRDIQSLDALSASLVEEIEHFFVSYNEVAGKSFRVLGRAGPDRARALVEKAARQFQTQQS
jgi:inorganic pyrophosphatase